MALKVIRPEDGRHKKKKTDPAQSAQRANRTILRRTLVLLVVFGIGVFIPLIATLYNLMIKQHDYYEALAINNQTRSTPLSAARGLVYDRNMNILASSTTVETVFIDPNEIAEEMKDPQNSNLLNQMKEMGVADKYPQLLEEMPRVRAELGYPPLVTPTSQIVGTMAVLNVAVGRYKMIPREVKDLVAGKYGRTPAPIDPEIKRLVIGDAEPVTCRPADLIEPQLEKFRARLAEDGYPNASTEDLLSYISFPEVAKAFFSRNRD